MYKKILVPLDGSELAEAVLPHVESIVQAMGAEVILLRVPEYAYETGEPLPGALPRTPVLLPDDREAELREVTNYLNRVKLKLSLRGVHVSIEVREGQVAETITELARETGADLIAMSTHGRTGLSRMVFGSVADEVLHQANQPVLLIRPLQQ